jgi:hypothetical protein
MSGQSGAQNNAAFGGHRQLTNDTLSQGSVGVGQNLQMSQQMVGSMLTVNQINQLKLAKGQSGPANQSVKQGISYKKRMVNQNAQQSSKGQLPGSKKMSSNSQSG